MECLLPIAADETRVLYTAPPDVPGPFWAAPGTARGWPALRGTSHTLDRNQFLPF